jgi:hypothetical protein
VEGLQDGVTDGARTRDNQNHNLVCAPKKNRILARICGIFSEFQPEKNQQLATFALAIFSSFAAPLHAQSVYVHTTSAAHEADIKRALWVWRERLNWPLHYEGQTSQGCVQGPAITIRTPPQAEWDGAGVPASFDAFVGTCSGAPLPYDGKGFILALKPGEVIGQALFEHEIGHALGAWSHTFDPYAIMYPSAFASNSVTTRDVLAAFNGSFWPKPELPDFCFAELRADNGIFHPDIEGHAAMLGYVPLIVDGLTVEHRWKLLWRRPNAQTQGCAGDEVLPDGTVLLSDVRTPTNDFEGTISYSAELTYIGENTWALSTWEAVQ